MYKASLQEMSETKAAQIQKSQWPLVHLLEPATVFFFSAVKNHPVLGIYFLGGGKLTSNFSATNIGDCLPAKKYPFNFQVVPFFSSVTTFGDVTSKSFISCSGRDSLTTKLHCRCIYLGMPFSEWNIQIWYRFPDAPCMEYLPTLRIQICPKKGINPTNLLGGWDWDHQTYSREGYGSLGIDLS